MWQSEILFLGMHNVKNICVPEKRQYLLIIHYREKKVFVLGHLIIVLARPYPKSRLVDKFGYDPL